jgi:hypothetical protein
LSSVFLVGLGLKEMKLASAFGKMILGILVSLVKATRRSQVTREIKQSLRRDTEMTLKLYNYFE